MMNKPYTKPILFVVVVFIIFSGILLINWTLTKESKNKENLNYYTSFVSSVQSLDKTMSQINQDKKDNELAALMFDNYTSILFVNERLDLLKNNSSMSADLNSLQNDLSLFKNYYEPLVRNQITNGGNLDTQIYEQMREHFHLFSTTLPAKYEDSKEFVQQFDKAVEHLKALVHLI
nr:hypothetical protein [Paenibacillus xylanexedens]